MKCDLCEYEIYNKLIGEFDIDCECIKVKTLDLCNVCFKNYKKTFKKKCIKKVNKK